jgi:hypothetical protein
MLEGGFSELADNISRIGNFKEDTSASSGPIVKAYLNDAEVIVQWSIETLAKLSISEFRVFQHAGSGFATKSQIYAGTGSAISVQHLPSGKYKFTVQAINKNGTSIVSTPSNIIRISSSVVRSLVTKFIDIPRGIKCSFDSVHLCKAGNGWRTILGDVLFSEKKLYYFEVAIEHESSYVMIGFTDPSTYDSMDYMASINTRAFVSNVRINAKTNSV